MLLKTKLIAAGVAVGLGTGIAIGSLMIPFKEGNLPTEIKQIEGQVTTTTGALTDAQKVIKGLENSISVKDNTIKQQGQTIQQQKDEMNPSSKVNTSSKNDTIEHDSQYNTPKDNEKIQSEIKTMTNQYKGLYEYEAGQVKKANSDVNTWSGEISVDTSNLNSKTKDLKKIMQYANSTYNLKIADLSSDKSTPVSDNKTTPSEKTK